MNFVDWYLHETDPYYFTVTYFLGDDNRLERNDIYLFHLFYLYL